MAERRENGVLMDQMTSKLLDYRSDDVSEDS